MSIITVLFAFVSGCVLILFSLRQQVLCGLKTVGAGLVAQGFGALLIGMRDSIPTALSVIAANTLILLGLLIINDGICRFRNTSRANGIPGLALVAASCLAITYYTYQSPSVPVRIFLVSSILAALAGLCARNLLHGSWGRTTSPQRFTAAGFVLYGCFMLFRAWWVLDEEIPHTFMSAGTVHGVAFLAGIALYLCIAYGMAWMANHALQEKLWIFKRIISSSPDLIALLDENGTYRMINDNGLKVLDIGHESIVGKNSADLFGEEFYNSVTVPNVRKALRGEVSTISCWIDNPKLGHRYVTLHYHPVPDADGRISLVAINARDMTRLRETQEERERIFTLSLDMLCVAGMDGYFRDINPAWERTMGWDKETLLRSRLIDFVHPEDVQAFIEAEKALMEGRPVVDFVNRCRTRDGSYRFISWTSHPDVPNQLIYAVARDVTDRMRLENRLKEQATRDHLTGAGNRRLFMQRAGEEIERSVRYGTPLSLLMLDIDHFKAINDTYGHDAGDEVLKALVAETRKQLRTSDVFCRLGGEEFAALLINADAEAAETLAERIRQSPSRLTVTSGRAAIAFTVSIGATTSASGDDVASMLKRADTALYEAKRNGRNQVRTG
ncbi:sensor domain-containing diguanylate cyclase [Desulfocurvus sp. DL9XJH121]